MHPYPLRLTRTYWKIPLYCYHECSEDICSTLIHYNRHDDNIFLTFHDNLDYIDGKCKEYNDILPTFIHINSFNISEPYGHKGKLFNPDLIVIPDNEFSIKITFPLTTPANINIKTEKNFTLKEIIWLIKDIYKKIYNDEENTSDSSLFFIDNPCNNCVNMNIENTLTVSSTDEKENCSICFLKLNGDKYILKCNHLFHTDCLNNWINKGKGTTCPLCRKPLYICDKCNNNGIFITREEYVVLPFYLRPSTNMNRNNTNGLYGIHSYDLENLAITKLYYNRLYKILQVIVQPI